MYLLSLLAACIHIFIASNTCCFALKVTLYCIAKKSACRYIQTQWFYRSQDSAEFREIYNVQHLKHYTVNNVLKDNVGEYKCTYEIPKCGSTSYEVSLKGFRVASSTMPELVITGSKLQFLLDQPKVLMVDLGTNVTLDCNLHDSSRIVKWLKNDWYPLVASPTVNLRNVALNQVGSYRCIAKNTYGSIERNFNLGIKGHDVIKPIMSTDTMSNLDVVVTDVARLVCKAHLNDHNVLYDMTWLKWHFVQKNTYVMTKLLNVLDYCEVLEPSERYVIGSSRDGESVQVSELMLPRSQFKDAGFYTCVCSNSAGIAWHTIQLDVSKVKIKWSKGNESSESPVPRFAETDTKVKSKSLSTTMIASIAVCCGAVVTILLVLLGCKILRRRKQNNRESTVRFFPTSTRTSRRTHENDYITDISVTNANNRTQVLTPLREDEPDDYEMLAADQQLELFPPIRD